MRRLYLLLSIAVFIPHISYTQTLILEENFGTSSWEGNPAEYPGYTSAATFTGDDSHAFPLASSTGYEGASGGGAILMGNWNTEGNITFIIQLNTEDYINVLLAFGMKHNSAGWGAGTLTNNYTVIEYSTDAISWDEMDKAQLLDGTSWPDADDDVWSLVKLAQVLPSSPTLYIRFTHSSPDVHPYYLDDITLTAYMPDTDPPGVPANLTADSIGFDQLILSWDASDDAGGIARYQVYKNGNYLFSTKDTIVRVKYQEPGSNPVFSVVAVDIADNTSEISQELSVALKPKPSNHKYSWQTQHAQVQPSGRLKWQPRDFVYTEGPSVRYIDYASGNDANDGMTKATPWKHHPWDSDASGNAKSASGIHTYVFKRGVVYRGKLVAKESGTALNPIRLTSDPSWGSGEAFIFGSRRLSGTWKKANALIAPNIPEVEKVWYLGVSIPETKMICEVTDGNYRELHVARSPNFQEKIDDEDPMGYWYTWTGKQSASGAYWLIDTRNLNQTHPDYYKGATVFSNESAIVMCTVWKQDVAEWDPDNHRIKVKESDFAGKGSKYFIENTPFLLDAPGEYYIDRSYGKVFLRLEEGRDPNDLVFEAAMSSEQIRIDNKHDIVISGLTFGMTYAHKVRYGASDAFTSIRMTGICNNIEIRNNKFRNVVGGVSVNNNGSQEVNTHSITIADNDMQDVQDLAIVLSTSEIYMDDISILRNNINNCGYRHQGRWYSSIPAIYGQINYGEIAGNIVKDSWGNGIDVFWGKGGWDETDVPFIRGLIHHNSAFNTLIGTNDYGGIESWQGGPAYCYNNYSHNASGYKHYNNSSIGYAYYFDGSFKHIVFNNIASGISHNRNSAAIMQVLGYSNIYAHNSAYLTDKFFNAWKGTLAICGYNTYLSNVAQDVKRFFVHEISPQGLAFDAYGHNVSAGTSFNSAIESLDQSLSLSGFKARLDSYPSQLTQTGYDADADVLAGAAHFDFRATPGSEAIDKGVKFFTPYPLAKVVGEWHFYKHPADSSVVMADNFYMTEDFNNRETYHEVPKNHLKVHDVTLDHFVMGDLEDWTEGALEFDGQVYASVSHDVASVVKSNNVDMTENSFILETYLKVSASGTGAALISKYDNAAGYTLALNNSNQVSMDLFDGGASVITTTGAISLNDDQWHHILVEVDRYSGIRIFVDGLEDTGSTIGSMPDPSFSLSNTADLFIGKNNEGNHFLGTIDFVRISKGSLYEARTTIDELYTWTTDGPFLYDIKGNVPEGKRDAGAIEVQSICSFETSATSVHLDSLSGEKKIKVAAGDGIDFWVEEAAFFEVELVDDSIVIRTEENPYVNERSGSVFVSGCGEVQEISVSQAGAACVFVMEQDSIVLEDHLEQVISIPVVTNGGFTVGILTGSWVGMLPSSGNDSILLTVETNSMLEERSISIPVTGCLGTAYIKITQEAMPCVFTMDVDTIMITHHAFDTAIAFTANSEVFLDYTTDSPYHAELNESNDSVQIFVERNDTEFEKFWSVNVSSCDTSYSITIMQDGNVGFEGRTNADDFKVYPNPVSSGVIYVHLSELRRNLRYSITDLSGKVIQNGFMVELKNTLNISSNPGTYILILEDTERTSQALIVVQ